MAPPDGIDHIVARMNSKLKSQSNRVDVHKNHLTGSYYPGKSNNNPETGKRVSQIVSDAASGVNSNKF